MLTVRLQDELLWGASWIHRASQNGSYLDYIKSNGHTLGAYDDNYSFSWDDKRPATKVLLSKVFNHSHNVLNVTKSFEMLFLDSL